MTSGWLKSSFFGWCISFCFHFHIISLYMSISSWVDYSIKTFDDEEISIKYFFTYINIHTQWLRKFLTNKKKLIALALLHHQFIGSLFRVWKFCFIGDVYKSFFKSRKIVGLLKSNLRGITIVKNITHIYEKLYISTYFGYHQVTSNGETNAPKLYHVLKSL